MTQKDRISAILYDIRLSAGYDATDDEMAEALYAHGIRVVDQDTLSEALNVAGTALRQPYRLAALSIVDALDKEA